MNQTRRLSIIEILTSTAIGFFVALFLIHYALPLWGLHPTNGDGWGIATLFTVVSIVRGYLVRRYFNRQPSANPEGDLDQFQKMTFDWSKITFPTATLESRLAHMVYELDEIRRLPADLTEWADAFLLFIQAAKVAGHTMSNIIYAARYKHRINKKRKWGKPNAQGFTEHIN